MLIVSVRVVNAVSVRCLGIREHYAFRWCCWMNVFMCVCPLLEILLSAPRRIAPSFATHRPSVIVCLLRSLPANPTHANRYIWFDKWCIENVAFYNPPTEPTGPMLPATEPHNHKTPHCQHTHAQTITQTERGTVKAMGSVHESVRVYYYYFPLFMLLEKHSHL